jgi:Curli assembly protein CsgE
MCRSLAMLQGSVILVALAFATNSYGQSDGSPIVSAAPAQSRGSSAAEFGGVVTSHALTPFGYWFHGWFTQQWNTHADVDVYQLLVRERLLPRGGSEVQIYLGETLLYRANLPRNQQQIISLAESAVDTVYDNAVEQGLQALLFKDPDLSASGL